jgi:very-short-patch-repair endonuclease
MVWLIVEVDSVEHHGLGWTPEATSLRRAELVAAGWTVLSVSPYRIGRDGPGLIDQIESTYRRLALIHAA